MGKKDGHGKKHGKKPDPDKKMKHDHGKKHGKKAEKKSVPHCPHCHNHCPLTHPKCKKGAAEAKKLGI